MAMNFFPFVGTYVVFDTETTGFSYSAGAEVVELSAVKVVNGAIVDTFSTLVKPLNGINEEAAKVNHITAEMVQNAPPMSIVFNKFLQFAGNVPLVAHNAAFDLGFMNGYCQQYYDNNLPNSFICTLEISRELLPDESHKLMHLVNYFNIQGENSHRALDDVLCTAELLKHLAMMLANGQRTLETAGYIHRSAEIDEFSKKMRRKPWEAKKTAAPAPAQSVAMPQGAQVMQGAPAGTVPMQNMQLGTMPVQTGSALAAEGSAKCDQAISDIKWFLFGDEHETPQMRNELGYYHGLKFKDWCGVDRFTIQDTLTGYEYTVQIVDKANMQPVTVAVPEDTKQIALRMQSFLFGDGTRLLQNAEKFSHGFVFLGWYGNDRFRMMGEGRTEFGIVVTRIAQATGTDESAQVLQRIRSFMFDDGDRIVKNDRGYTHGLYFMQWQGEHRFIVSAADGTKYGIAIKKLDK